MDAFQVDEETKIKTSFRFVWALTAALAVCFAWVKVVDFKLHALEAKASSLELNQVLSDKDRIVNREKIVAAIYELKAEVAGLRAEIRASRNGR